MCHSKTLIAETFQNDSKKQTWLVSNCQTIHFFHFQSYFRKTSVLAKRVSLLVKYSVCSVKVRFRLTWQSGGGFPSFLPASPGRWDLWHLLAWDTPHPAGLSLILQLQQVILQYSSTPVNTHQYRYDSSVFLLDQVTDDLVVEELNRLPLGRNDKPDCEWISTQHQSM